MRCERYVVMFSNVGSNLLPELCSNGGRAIGWAKLAKLNAYRESFDDTQCLFILGKRWTSFYSAQPTALISGERSCDRVAKPGKNEMMSGTATPEQVRLPEGLGRILDGHVL
ncbi:hypothetical protein C2I19_00225 [Chromobacterium alticapitis]|uniref:Uncharacterized protein n=1 Tax=Chromobacterium alticapitis TaxID=2073169 RepID=A0A2S5DLZ5_9NEIS|nr:hypothetical protein C2I19_00225 [Chromobacterium alticapitis]